MLSDGASSCARAPRATRAVLSHKKCSVSRSRTFLTTHDAIHFLVTLLRSLAHVPRPACSPTATSANASAICTQTPPPSLSSVRRSKPPSRPPRTRARPVPEMPPMTALATARQISDHRCATGSPSPGPLFKARGTAFAFSCSRSHLRLSRARRRGSARRGRSHTRA